MPKTVAFHNPAFEDGILFDVGGLGIENGGSVELTEEQELTFFSKHQTTLDDYFKDNEHVKISGTTELSKEVRDAHTPGEPSTEPEVEEVIEEEDEEGGDIE